MDEINTDVTTTGPIIGDGGLDQDNGNYTLTYTTPIIATLNTDTENFVVADTAHFPAYVVAGLESGALSASVTLTTYTNSTFERDLAVFAGPELPAIKTQIADPSAANASAAALTIGYGGYQDDTLVDDIPVREGVSGITSSENEGTASTINITSYFVSALESNQTGLTLGFFDDGNETETYQSLDISNLSISIQGLLPQALAGAGPVETLIAAAPFNPFANATFSLPSAGAIGGPAPANNGTGTAFVDDSTFVAPVNGYEIIQSSAQAGVLSGPGLMTTPLYVSAGQAGYIIDAPDVGSGGTLGIAQALSGLVFTPAAAAAAGPVTFTIEEFSQPNNAPFEPIVVADATFTLHDATDAEDTFGGGSLGIVFNGGTALLDQVTSGGELIVSSGGVGLFTSVSSKGEVVVQSGGSISNSTVSAGAIEFISSGASSTDAVLSGEEIVVSGGTATGTQVQLYGLLDLEGVAFANGGKASLNSATDVLTISQGGRIYTEQLGGSYLDKSFRLLSDPYGGTMVQVVSAACYAAGSMILTTDGERPVELLAIGEIVVTASSKHRPIHWVGSRTYVGRFLAANPGVQPIRFTKGSLGDGLPRRDLLVSPDHAMFLDGMLIPAKALVNGTTINAERGLERIDYYHVELDSHDMLLAEGATSESYFDEGDSLRFHNAGDRPVRPEPAVRCAPLVEHGPELEAVRARLAGGAEKVAFRSQAA